jgi:hypothetical protein
MRVHSPRRWGGGHVSRSCAERRGKGASLRTQSGVVGERSWLKEGPAVLSPRPDWLRARLLWRPLPVGDAAMACRNDETRQACPAPCPPGYRRRPGGHGGCRHPPCAAAGSPMTAHSSASPSRATAAGETAVERAHHVAPLGSPAVESGVHRDDLADRDAPASSKLSPALQAETSGTAWCEGISSASADLTGTVISGRKAGAAVRSLRLAPELGVSCARGPSGRSWESLRRW